ncbi:probable ureidoglycolate hydrolase isoform X1 [Panicum hallii]|uniref:probable ureidoglycolate hydrolase isoform X1 n=1 Tax=Panicum hallii TaxID=206008 RepID=UPI000DF4CC03|nr:probable ureidoglycolate hydrolase isoform X1 [Panicum hallii]
MTSETKASRVLLAFLLVGAAAAAGGHDDAVARRTMEEFAGFPASDGGEGPSTAFRVDSEGLQRQIDELASFSDSPAPSVTRILYSDKDVQARRYIKGIMNQLGLAVREDAVGNIFGRWEGSEAVLGAVGTGSHVDAIPFSGKYDGVVGVLGALEAISLLKRSGFQPKRSLDVIMFTSEEPTRFGISCLGSRLMAGIEELAQSLRKVVDNQNVSFLDAAESAGYKMHPEDLQSVFLKKDSYSAFIELHIEQGPILEKEGIPIGIVTAIAAPASITVEFEGNGGHAGAVLMPARNDAGLAAAELALAVEKHVLESGSIDTVGTVGILQLHPGAINSIPSKSHLEIDVRDIDEKRRNDVIEKIRRSATEISKNRGVVLSEFKIINQDPPALSDKSVVEAMEFSAKQLNLEYKKMISRAYHDSLFMARVSPMGMIFIPCYKGLYSIRPSPFSYSHKPEEYASPEDMANGVKVLALTMAKLSLE